MKKLTDRFQDKAAKRQLLYLFSVFFRGDPLVHRTLAISSLIWLGQKWRGMSAKTQPEFLAAQAHLLLLLAA